MLVTGDEEAKRIILARRARFVAAALAGLNAAMCGGESDPRPCLTPQIQDGGTPQPCLSPEEPDASKDSGDADAEPQPCLAPQPPDASDDGG